MQISKVLIGGSPDIESHLHRERGNALLRFKDSVNKYKKILFSLSETKVTLCIK